MKIILSLTLMCRAILAVQVVSVIPEAQIRLTPFYLSSQKQETRMKLSAPAALTVARSGNVFVFDDGNSRIVKLDPRGNFIAEFGQPGSGPGTIRRGGLNDSIAV